MKSHCKIYLRPFKQKLNVTCEVQTMCLSGLLAHVDRPPSVGAVEGAELDAEGFKDAAAAETRVSVALVTATVPPEAEAGEVFPPESLVPPPVAGLDAPVGAL